MKINTTIRGMFRYKPTQFQSPRLVMRSTPIYSLYADGLEICWGFDCVCINHGDCSNCPKMQAYDDHCAAYEATLNNN